MNSVAPMGGPGSMEVGVKIDLADLQSELIRASHPLGSAPQWRGEQLWSVLCRSNEDFPGLPGRKRPPKVMIVRAKGETEAMECALHHLNTKHSKIWEAKRADVLICGSTGLVLELEIL